MTLWFSQFYSTTQSTTELPTIRKASKTNLWHNWNLPARSIDVSYLQNPLATQTSILYPLNIRDN